MALQASECSDLLGKLVDPCPAHAGAPSWCAFDAGHGRRGSECGGVLAVLRLRRGCARAPRRSGGVALDAASAAEQQQRAFTSTHTHTKQSAGELWKTRGKTSGAHREATFEQTPEVTSCGEATSGGNFRATLSSFSAVVGLPGLPASTVPGGWLGAHSGGGGSGVRVRRHVSLFAIHRTTHATKHDTQYMHALRLGKATEDRQDNPVDF